MLTGGYTDSSGQSHGFIATPIPNPPPQVLYAGGAVTGDITEITSGGVQSTLAQLPVYSAGMAFDRAGDLFIGDSDGNVYESIAGGAPIVFAANVGGGVGGLAINSAGNLFVANGIGAYGNDGNGDIYEFTPGGVKSIFASLGEAQNLAFDGAGNLFVSQSYGGNIIKITPSGTQSTFASGLNYPEGLTFDNSGNLYVSVSYSGAILKIAPNGTQTTFATGLSYPGGLAFDNAGNLFEADAGNHAIYEFATDGTRSTFASLPNGGEYLVFGPPLPPQPASPVVKCKDVTVSAGADCSANASIDDGSYDPNPGDTITLSQSPAGPYPLGTTPVTLTVTDNHGASSSCTATVTVVDTTPPTIACPADISIGCGVDLLVPVSFSATATDNCDPSPTITCSPASGSRFPIGTTIVTCSATDASGKSLHFAPSPVHTSAIGFWQAFSRLSRARDATGGSFANPVRTFKAGSTIPVKFTASCGGSPVATGIHTLRAAPPVIAPPPP